MPCKYRYIENDNGAEIFIELGEHFDESMLINELRKIDSFIISERKVIFHSVGPTEISEEITSTIGTFWFDQIYEDIGAGYSVIGSKKVMGLIIEQLRKSELFIELNT